MAKSVVCDLLQIFKASVSAVLPGNLIRNSIKYNPVNKQLSIVDENYNIHDKNVFLIGTGKAVQNMAIEVEKILDTKIKKGIISIPVGSFHQNTASKNVVYHQGAKNNLPDENAEYSAKLVNDLVLKLDDKDLLLVLISGGGSALLPLPKEPISLDEKTVLIKKLANSGADIKELNTVRKKLSSLKGGQLAIKAQPARVISLILSDIVGDPLDLIASGPTVENEDHSDKAINIINKYKLYDELPPSMKNVLNERNDITIFPRDNVRNFIIGSNKLSVLAAINESKDLNYLPITLSNTVTGNVKDVAIEYVKLAKSFCEFSSGKSDMNILKLQIKSLNIPGINSDFFGHVNDVSLREHDLCLILGGEITVEVKGKGKGGRSQQLALEFSKFLHNIKKDVENYDICLLSAGTDGIDGPTDAAGAIGYKDLIADCEEDNIDVNFYLENNDSYNFYKKFKNGSLHVITGHTYTNVMDIHLIIIKKNK